MPLAAVLIALALGTTGAVGAEQPASASAKLPASVGVATCKNSPWYAVREITFRTKISRLDPAVAQGLEVRLQVWRKLAEQRRFKRLKLPGLEDPASAKDPAATTYQRDVTIKNVETAAEYRAKVTFRWRDATSGEVQKKHTLWSKRCKQKRGLPRLNVVKAQSLPVAGSDQVSHTLTVSNAGASEAQSVPVAIYVDGAAPIFQTIPSIGPRQAEDVTITVQSCRVGAYAIIDPLKSLVRLRGTMRRTEQLVDCASGVSNKPTV